MEARTSNLPSFHPSNHKEVSETCLPMQPIENYIQQNRGRFLEELFTLLRQRSISATGEGVEECAERLTGMMREIGIAAQILPWKHHPFIFKFLDR